MKRIVSVVVAIGLLLGVGLGARPALAEEDVLMKHPCFGKDIMERLAGCTELLNRKNTDPLVRAFALAGRGLSLSLLGRYDEAMRDYDAAIELNPNFPVALNNRAWAKYKMGKLAAALVDVEQALSLNPISPHAHDTRAHILQAQGQFVAALRDYRAAMTHGGAPLVRLYQCGLQASGVYLGPVTGIITEQLQSALKTCVNKKTCDPLPAEEECKAAMS